MNTNKIIEIVENIKENADAILQKGHMNEVEYGQLLAYAESLTIIQDAFAGEDLREIGLDIDVEKIYLGVYEN